MLNLINRLQVFFFHEKIFIRFEILFFFSWMNEQSKYGRFNGASLHIWLGFEAGF
jgi:hypothetical protein